MRFERGKGPGRALKIGKNRDIKKGTYFPVRFRVQRYKDGKYLHVQEKEKEGIPADAVALVDERLNLKGERAVHCIVNTIPHEKFNAFWSEKEECWIIGRSEHWKYTNDTGPK